jgi:hypothetical protein
MRAANIKNALINGKIAGRKFVIEDFRGSNVDVVLSDAPIAALMDLIASLIANLLIEEGELK